MTVVNRRTQHAVGQGFFHSAVLSEDDELRLRFVYDCGAKALYRDARSDRIDELLADVGPKARLDVLFLSHVHEDHVNGVEQLLNSVTGFQVDTIVLPLVDVVDRLIAYSCSVSEDAGAADSHFYRDFIVDPTGALSRFGPRQLLFVRPGQPDGGAPGSDDRPIDGPDGGGEVSGLRGEKGRTSWKLVGRGVVAQPRAIEPGFGSASTVRVAEIEDSIGLAVPTAGPAQFWLLAPFVDPTVEAKRVRFVGALSRRLGIPVRILRSLLTDPGYLNHLLVNNLSKLKAAYGIIAKDLNITSMSLYSGPARVDSSEPRSHHGRFGKWGARGDGGVAWLATGDSALKEKVRRDEFLGHYGKLLDQVITFTMPHHGSDHNFHVDLLGGVDPTFCVAAADHYMKWQHPGAHAIQSVASAGLFLSVVTSDALSRVEEIVEVG